MKRIKGSNVLRRELRDFTAETKKSISAELLRIGRTVRMEEFEYIPFNGEVDIFIEAIRIDRKKKVIIDTSFDDVKQKPLSDFISDREISHDLLIDLLDMLKGIAGKHGQKPSVLTAVGDEKIRYDQDQDDWICLCGNYPALHGFYPCDEDGNWIEPAEEWNDLYRCHQCGRVIDDTDHRIIGMNLHPTGKANL